MEQVRVKTEWMKNTDISYSVVNALREEIKHENISLQETLMAVIKALPVESQRAVAEDLLIGNKFKTLAWEFVETEKESA